MMDPVLSKEVAQLSNDLAHNSVWNLGSDLPVVGDAIRRLLLVIQNLDARVTVLEKNSHPAVPDPRFATPPSVAGPNVGSPVPPGAKA